MKIIYGIMVLAVLSIASVASADEVLNDEVMEEQIDPVQVQHWKWCGKRCREGAEKKAKKILRRLDNLTNKYESHEEFYADSSEIFRRKATQSQWVQAFSIREILGNPLRRVHESTQGVFRKLPNVDKEKDYLIVTFDTMFENDKGIYTEQISLNRKANGKFKFVGYYFAKKASYNY